MGVLTRMSPWVTSVHTLSRLPNLELPLASRGPRLCPGNGRRSATWIPSPAMHSALALLWFPARINERKKTELQNLTFFSHCCLLMCLWPWPLPSKSVTWPKRLQASASPRFPAPATQSCRPRILRHVGLLPAPPAGKPVTPLGPPSTPELPEPTLLFPLSTFPSHAGPIRVNKTALERKAGGEHPMSLEQNDH